MRKLMSFYLRGLRNYVLIVIGCIIAALGFVLFLVPHNIPPGGVSSLSMIFHHFFNTPFGLVMLVFNIPLFILGVKKLGRIFGLRTLIGVILLSLFSDFFTYILKFDIPTSDPLLASLYGGALLGIGLGFIFKAGGSSGGSSIIGRIVGKYTNLSTGYGMLLADTFSIVTFSLFMRSYEPALYGFISLFLCSKVIDIILEGREYAKAVYIFSKRPNKIADCIMKDMQRGVTLLHGEGMHSKGLNKVLLCIVTRKEVQQLRDIIWQEDRDAFVVISNVHEVLGKGFRTRT